MESENRKTTYEQERDSEIRPPLTPRRLGSLKQLSIDEDWALIEITDDSIVVDLWLDASKQERPAHINESSERTSATVCNNKGSGTAGTLSTDTSYMRLPLSSKFVQVRHVVLDNAIAWGDCGSPVLDMSTRDFFGHVIASSEDRRTIYIIPASRLAISARIDWKSSEIIDDDSSPTTAGKPATKFIFRIEEFQQDGDHISDPKGGPVVDPESYVKSDKGASEIYWFCNGKQISRLPNRLHMSKPIYSTSSTIYFGGRGFYVLRGDATDPPNGGDWHSLRFNHDETRNSSALTHSGKSMILIKHDANATWPRMLLPDIYHNSAEDDSDDALDDKYSSGIMKTHNAQGSFGGLTGDLAIFLALFAFSRRPDTLATEIPKFMHDGQWVTSYSGSHGRKFMSKQRDSEWQELTKNVGDDKRGVVVTVYPYNNNEEELLALENGERGMYFK